MIHKLYMSDFLLSQASSRIALGPFSSLRPGVRHGVMHGVAHLSGHLAHGHVEILGFGW